MNALQINADAAPRVSVVMPVYNVEAYVAEAIRSVLAQTFTDFELNIVDDGGSDASMEICRSFSDPRITIVSQRNRGLAGARNTGIAASRGEFVALLDSDDRWLPEKLMLHVIHLDNAPKIGVSFAPSRFIDAAGQPLRIVQRPKLKGIAAKDIFCRNPVGNGSAPVLRRSALDTVAFAHPDERSRTCWFDETLRQSEDIEMWLRLSLTGGVRFEGIAAVLTEYRIGGSGLSAQILRQYESWQGVVARMERYAPEFAARHVARARAYQLRYLARRAIQLGDAGMAMALLRGAAMSSLRPLLEEPAKSLTTLAAALVGRMIGPDHFARLAGRAAGGQLVA
ncbi:glycosyltransferase family 2 protein [Novosphingobium sp.]|uniref:glycosyltransferase family 2 protein n=1 Tax=Novosphingobium sp. TaxID=1874826 RepID=UPI003BAC526C